MHGPVRGRAEETWPRFLEEYQAENSAQVYRPDGLVDMALSPTPRFELLKLDRYTTTTIETSRGCPYSCEFCEIPERLGKKSRAKSAEQVMTEVRKLAALGADSLFFIDDYFVGNPKRTKALLKELIAY